MQTASCWQAEEEEKLPCLCLVFAARAPVHCWQLCPEQGYQDGLLSLTVLIFSCNFKFLMFVNTWVYVKRVAWCIKGLISSGSKKCLYIHVSYPHVLCDIVLEALDAAVLAARGSGQPQKAVILPRAASDVMIFLSSKYTTLL